MTRDELNSTVTVDFAKAKTELEEIAHSFSNGLLRNENVIKEIYEKVSRIKSFPPSSMAKAEHIPQELGIVSDMWDLTLQLKKNNLTLEFILKHLSTLI